MHDGSVIFDANLEGDFSGAEAKFLRKEIHGDLAGGFNVGDTGFAAHLLGAEIKITSDTINDLFRGNRMMFGGFVDGNRTIMDELQWGKAADLGH